MTTYDLHGHARTPFLDWDEEITYLERVSIPGLDDVKQFLSDEMCVNIDELDPKPIFMRFLDRDGTGSWKDESGEMHYSGWWECTEADEGAVPFWKEG